MRFSLLALIAALPACAAPPPAPESQRGGGVEPGRGAARGVRVAQRAQEFLQRAGLLALVRAGAEGGARVCSIYAPAPRSERDLQRFATLGHELMHCFDGNWHDRWGRMNPSTQSAAAGGSR